MSDSFPVSYEGIEVAEKSAIQVLDKIVEKLSGHGESKDGGSPRLFFPNGIELISIVVKVNPATGLDFEITVSGDKAAKPMQLTA